MVYSGKPYEQMDDLGGPPLFFETPISRSDNQIVTNFKFRQGLNVLLVQVGRVCDGEAVSIVFSQHRFFFLKTVLEQVGAMTKNLGWLGYIGDEVHYPVKYPPSN